MWNKQQLGDPFTVLLLSYKLFLSFYSKKKTCQVFSHIPENSVVLVKGTTTSEVLVIDNSQ